MIKSMTGFGRCEIAEEKRKVTVEMKSVNHRYLDVTIKMPKKLNFFDASIRNLLKEYMQRGKVDLFITYEDTSDSSVVSYAFSNGNFVDEKAPTDARATYYKKWTDDNYTIMGGYPHILKINGPGLIYSLYKAPSDLLTKAYNMTRWTGKDGLDTDFVECPDGTENYFYLADLESMSWKLCKDFVLPAEKMCLVVNSASCSKDFQGAPEVIYWSQQAAEQRVAVVAAEAVIQFGIFKICHLLKGTSYIVNIKIIFKRNLFFFYFHLISIQTNVTISLHTCTSWNQLTNDYVFFHTY